MKEDADVQWNMKRYVRPCTAVPIHAMKAYSGNTRTAPPILNPATRRRSHPGHSPLRKEPRYRLNKRLGEPQRRSGRSEEEKYLLLLPVFEPRTVQRQPISQTRCYRPYRTCYVDSPAIGVLPSELMKGF